MGMNSPFVGTIQISLISYFSYFIICEESSSPGVGASISPSHHSNRGESDETSLDCVGPGGFVDTAALWQRQRLVRWLLLHVQPRSLQLLLLAGLLQLRTSRLQRLLSPALLQLLSLLRRGMLLRLVIPSRLVCPPVVVSQNRRAVCNSDRSPHYPPKKLPKLLFLSGISLAMKNRVQAACGRR
jgi:hypothetical protein